MRKCSRCQRYFDKRISVYARKKVKDKVYIYYMCHECNNSRAKKYRATSEYSKQYLKLRNRENYKFNKEKVLARCSVAYALKKGFLIKPQRCSSCKNFGKIQAHHPDYSKRLEIVWLCVTCHHLIDKK